MKRGLNPKSRKGFKLKSGVGCIMNKIGDLLRIIGYSFFLVFMIASLFLSGLVVDCLGVAAIALLITGISLRVRVLRKEYKQEKERIGIA
jgi:hypothetical protein